MGAAHEISKYDKSFLVKLLREMVLIRRFEEKCAQMYGLQKIGGFCHLYIGQESVAIGSIGALNLETDYVLTSYRDHGHALACGMHPNVVMAELFGKESGCSRGKGGSMHLFDGEKHFYGGNGIVGGQIPMATGVAMKIAYKEEAGVVLCYFGDGAIHQGAFHESLNLAKIWDLPIIYICENNHYGMGTAFHRVSSVHDFSIMGESYGIPGTQVNGMDVLEVYEAVSAAAEQARKKHMPSFLEIKTYRYRGHSMSDPAKYRSKEELLQHKEQDPILLLKTSMLEHNLLGEDEFQELDKECKDLSSESVRFSEESDEPALKSLYEDILA
ncbi:MAG: pyruvate dehydrogenase (acetyl-transferring) E1 component subunit alpha [bacterium]|nr:pyruvate dehydrogenase (acetyl-transferring) E1 component subunit alpha [bacterium]